ncbi:MULTISPECIES: copper homeostasis periplasmic binding protein CopC [Paraburkholderia]|uniref:Copper resistance protein CopC n=1 Tax=Paraburkholderia hospita TaxID=169430 RepID=A0AAJ5BBB9_9BURK|nr:copper homeostasis periplasmic binding protein CopC [Paraburkholderia hospita]SKC84819.1 Copper-binding protein CopC (methionine-rich) [Burkholderia sp. CF099]SOE90481.1 Copper-binding protein CopC (methionine-rich) [Burkholderia sp. YR290]AUT72975.1 copper resistance protein CopC [Paraburkholderia hospita]AXF03068.1 copper resistance protein CopC [Paraburkholderia hospita]EIM96222.1 Cu resistance protein CopC [Paraburkholderia hospita]
MKTFNRKQLTRLAAAAAIALVPAAAFAHGKLENAVPAAGSALDAAPDALRLTFNEDLESTFSTVKVSDANGAAVTREKAKVDASNPRVLTVALPKISSGSYSVQWAVMTHDAHKTKGTYTFQVK